MGDERPQPRGQGLQPGGGEPRRRSTPGGELRRHAPDPHRLVAEEVSMAGRKPVAAVWRILAVVASAVAFTPVALWWLRLLGLVPDTTPFAAIEYLPPSWILAAVIPAVALLFVAKARIAASLLLFSWCAVALFRGDHGMATRPVPSVEGGAEVGLLEWNVRGIQADAIAARLLERRPDVALLAGASPETVADLRTRLGTFHFQLVDAGAGGAAIITPHRVVASRSLELPPDAGAEREHRRVLHAELELLGTKVHVVAVNFGDQRAETFRERLGEAGRRLAARDAGCRFLSSFVARLDGPVVVGGDLDAPPSTTAVRRLAGMADDLFLAGDPMNLASLRNWRAPIRTGYLFVRDFDPVEAEQVPAEHAEQGPVVGVARLSTGPRVPSASDRAPAKG